jgi:hypothetical protein
LPPAELVDLYFRHMRGRDLEGLAALFTEEAVMLLPDGREVLGLAALRGMYQHIFSGQAPSPSPGPTIVGAGVAAAEIEARFEDGTSRRTANFFHFAADGRIARLSVYRRGE